MTRNLIRSSTGDRMLGLIATDPQHPEVRELVADLRERGLAIGLTDDEAIESLGRVLARAKCCGVRA